MQNFCKKKEYDDLEKYLSEMLDDISGISKNDYNVGNEIINTVINHYFHPIRESCKIKVSGFVDDEINIEQRDLCIVISNLVKNAVESMEKCQGDEKGIVFEVKQGKQFLHIVVKNTVDSKKLVLKNNLPVTTKKNKMMHGIGLKNIAKVAEKYCGKYSYTIEDGYYIAEVHLQI
jgi:sensor histidine kinase regulating citrate/malate metabolism